MKLRQEVLTQWPTGQGVDLEDAFAFHKSLPQKKSFPRSSLLPKSSAKPWFSPGPASLSLRSISSCCSSCRTKAKPTCSPSTIDSYTRQNRYEEAENGIRESMRLGRAMLNGFPAVNHGVSGCRHVVNSVRVPPSGPSRHPRRPASHRDFLCRRLHQL